MRQELPAIDAPTTPHTPPPKDSAHISVTGSTRTSCSSDSDSTLHSTPFVTPFGSSSDRSTAPTSASPGSRRRYSPKASIAALAALGGVLSSLPEAVLQTTSDSLDTQTPFGLGFVLPPGKGSWRLYELVHEAQTIGNRANLLVFPESAYQAYDKWDRQYAIDKFVSEVCRQYGVWVQLGIDTPSDEYHIEELSLGGANSTYTTVQAGKKINEVVLLGPEGYTGSYVKQTLIPCKRLLTSTRGQADQPCRRRVVSVPQRNHACPDVDNQPATVSSSSHPQVIALYLTLQTAWHQQDRLDSWSSLRAPDRRLPPHLSRHLPPGPPCLPRAASRSFHRICRRSDP